MNQQKNYLALGALALFTMPIASQVNADILHLDDVIITFSACVGNDCVNGENFGFDTIRVKENNVRIHFEDTSTSASFPSVDWRLTANDSSNGGANKFSIDNATTGAIPFTILSGAPSNSLFVDAQGDVGIGTSTAVVETHIVDGDSPTIRLEQDGSSGFTPQTWDLAGNEANFFVRDVTNGSRLPFKIKPSAPTDSLFVDINGDIGMSASTNPEGSLHVRRTGTTSPTILLHSTEANVKWEMKANANTGKFTIKDLVSGTSPIKIAQNATGNLFTVGDVAPDMVDIDGNLNVQGDLTVTGNCTEVDGACADYVFEDDYNLRSLQDVAVFIKEKKHLPNVPSAKEMEKNGISLAHITGRLLEKIEELTLYTLQQENMIAGLNQRLESIETIKTLETRTQ